jgi:hypothetical protein
VNQAKVLDSRDYALVVLVDQKGVADIQCKMSKRQAAIWLREAADALDAQVDGK